MGKEPVLIVALVVATAQLLAAFGVSITADQVDAIVKWIMAIAPVATILGGLVARHFVTPVNGRHEA